MDVEILMYYFGVFILLVLGLGLSLGLRFGVGLGFGGWWDLSVRFIIIITLNGLFCLVCVGFGELIDWVQFLVVLVGFIWLCLVI